MMHAFVYRDGGRNSILDIITFFISIKLRQFHHQLRTCTMFKKNNPNSSGFVPKVMEGCVEDNILPREHVQLEVEPVMAGPGVVTTRLMGPELTMMVLLNSVSTSIEELSVLLHRSGHLAEGKVARHRLTEQRINSCRAKHEWINMKSGETAQKNLMTAQ